MRAKWFGPNIAGLALWLLPGSVCPALGQYASFEGRITTAEEVHNAVQPESLGFLRGLSWPHRTFSSGMEKGLVAFEKRKVRERYREAVDNLRKHGFSGHFGGMGEGSGFGGGAGYTIPAREGHALNLLGLITLTNYQEFEVHWSSRLGPSRFFGEGSYQWRPQENFYGLGHGSQRHSHTNFALRQTWGGVRWEAPPAKHFLWGALYRQAWIFASAGDNAAYPGPEIYFGRLAGYGSQTRLHSVGTYLDMNYLQGEYQWGGAAHWGASYQHGAGASHLRYFAYEMQLEGRMPVVSTSSVLVGQANFQLERERSGSDPIPFYMQPHIGGSSTLRGYPLDRFYGRNLALLTLEYRFKVHPNIQVFPFFDEGQIFDRTSDLRWLNWHRNYGFGFRFRSPSPQGTFMRAEFGWSGEGLHVHITFGDRQRPPLLAPVRYGLYKR